MEAILEKFEKAPARPEPANGGNEKG